MAAFAAGIGSCDMNLQPLTEGSGDSWYSTTVELDMAVNEFYVIGYWTPLTSMKYLSDNFSYRNLRRVAGFLDGTLNSSNDLVNREWTQSYKVVARANTLLENIEKNAGGTVPEEKLLQYKAEASFFRAVKYAELISLYGDVVYIDKYVTIDEAFAMGRSPKSEVIPKVYDDFDLACKYLPESYGAGSQRVTKATAYGMKARFALYMGDWAVAADAAKKCIDLKTYELYPDYGSLFVIGTEGNNNEIMFSIPRSKIYSQAVEAWVAQNDMIRNAGGYGSHGPTWDLLAAYLCTDGLPIDESPLFDPLNPFKNRDPRCAATIVEFGTAFCGYEYQTNPEYLTIMNYHTGVPKSNQDSQLTVEHCSWNGLNFRKGIDESWLSDNGQLATSNVDTDIMMLRYADVLLMYAEAKIELNEIDATVVSAINQVRARAYGATEAQTSRYPAVSIGNQSDMRRIVRLERRIELAYEGLRYMDLVRWRTADKHLNGNIYGLLRPASDIVDKVTSKNLWFWAHTPQIDEDGMADFTPLLTAGLCRVIDQNRWEEHNYLWPIPLSDTELIPRLAGEQNPGY